MNIYMKNRYKIRRQKLIDSLGGKCNVCNSSKNLELDHVDPSTKYKTITKLSSYSDKIWNEEIVKCQLLCKSCHLEKTKKEYKNGTITKRSR